MARQKEEFQEAVQAHEKERKTFEKTFEEDRQRLQQLQSECDKMRQLAEVELAEVQLAEQRVRHEERQQEATTHRANVELSVFVFSMGFARLVVARLCLFGSSMVASLLPWLLGSHGLGNVHRRRHAQEQLFIARINVWLRRDAS